MNILCMIPARSGSTRFPRKPLADICGKPMVIRVWDNCRKVKQFNDIVIATDDEEIKNTCESYGAHVIITGDCDTATERLYQVSKILDADLYVMVNGDEPLVFDTDIVKCIPESVDPDSFYASNLMTDFNNPVEVVDPTNLKIVVNKQGHCLFISRSPIPFPKGKMDYNYHKFVGVGAFTKEALDYYHSTPKGEIEMIEENDSFRFIENGKEIIYINAHCDNLSVDVPKDLIEVNQRFKMGGGKAYEKLLINSACSGGVLA